MSKPFRPSVNEMLTILVAIAAAATGIVFFVDDLRSPPTDYCITVDDAAAARIAGPGLVAIRAVAARDPWIANRHSPPFANYYVVAMEGLTADGTPAQGLWGVGVDDPAPASGAALTFGDDAVLTSLDATALAATDWPDTSLPFEADGTPASRARECLSDLEP